MKKILLLAAFCVAVFSNAQTIIYNADFSNNGDGFPDHTSTVPPVAGPTSVGPFGLSPNSWELSYSTTPSTDSSANSFKVVSGELQSDDWGGQGIFMSQNIDVSSISSTNITATGVNSGANDDNFTYFYILDGGSRVETPIGVSNNGDPINYSVVGLDVSSATSLIVGFEFSENGAGDGYDISVFQVTGTSSSGNPAPVISNISNSPLSPTSADIVTVTADVTDNTLLNSIQIEYGFSTGVYDQTPISMSATTGDTYTGNIPAQSDGTEVFYRIVATDDDPMPATGTSAEQSYTVMNPQPQGLQIDAVDTKYLIDFDNTVTNVNNGTFDGSGFTLVPTAGQLDANAFAISGLQDATTTFGDEQSGNDFGKGTSNGGVSSGGIYAFEVATNDYALGFQPTGSDFTPGTVEFLFTNNTGVAVTELAIAYDFYIYNNESRSNDFIFSHGPDSSSLTAVSDSRLTSELTSDSVPVWERNLVSVSLTGLSIPVNGTYVIAWSSVDQGSGSSDEIALDNIQIVANPSAQSVEALGDVESITLLGNLNLNGPTDLTGSLNLFSGALTTNDHLTLKSSAGKSAVVAPVVNGSVIGDVIVEQFYSNQRAFRFVGSTVNMTNSVFDDWQQGGLNPGDAGYTAGMGTHITGGTAANGFDQSSTNAPSIFTFNNNTQQWSSLNNTNTTSLTPGVPVRLFIRGDRSVSLTTAGAASTGTVLKTKGTLENGVVMLSGLSNVEGQYNFIANPYQAQINFNTLLNDPDTKDVRKTRYYAWDPTIGSNGAYSTYDFNLGMNNVGGSQVNEFLQPGQGVFVETSEDGVDNTMINAEIDVKQSFKTNNTATTNVFRSSNMNELINISLYMDSELASGKARDGVILSFNSTSSNLLNAKDAIKFTNPDENLSVLKGSQRLSIAEREIPLDNETIQLQLSGLSGNNYTFKLNNSLTGIQTLFVDTFLGTETLVNQGDNLINVSFDPNSPTSLNVNRFLLKFVNNVLTIGDSAFAKAVKIYPNPLLESKLTIDNLIVGEPVAIEFYNVAGQKIISFENPSSTGKETLLDMNALNNGIYFLRITQGDLTTTRRLVRK